MPPQAEETKHHPLVWMLHVGTCVHSKVHGPLLFSGRVLRLRRNMQRQKYALLTAHFPVLAQLHLGKGWIVRGTTTRKLPLS